MAKTFDGPPTLERSGSEHQMCIRDSTYGDEAGCLGADYESGIEYERGEINWILGIEK